MRSGRAMRLGWSTVMAAALVALVLTVTAHRVLSATETTVALAGVVLAAVSATAGAAVLRRRPGHLVGRLLAATGLGFAVKASLSSYAVWGLVAGHDAPGVTAAAWVQGWVVLLVYPAGLTWLLLAFPDGVVRSRLGRTAGRLALAGGVLVVAERLLEPVPVVAGLHLRLLDHNPSAVHAGWVDPLAAGWPLSLLAVVLAVADLTRRARGADARAMRLLAAVAVLLGQTAVVALLAAVQGGDTATWVQLALVVEVGVVLPVVLAAAVVDLPAFGLERLLDRTLTWTGLSLLVVGGYVGLVLYLTALLGKGGDEVLRVVATAVVAVAFQPLRGVVQRWVGRVVYGPQGDPRAAAVVLGRVSGQPGADLDAVARALRRGLGAERVVVALDAVGVGESGPADPTTTWPLVWDDEQVGRLEIDTRTAAVLPAGRARLRDEVADLLARAGHEARQRDRLATEQSRRLAAATDERRRLRHDLHDGVGPSLSGLRMTVAAARRHLGDPARADELLAQAAAGLEQLAQEVRRVLDRMGPGPLAGAGLAAAVADVAEQLGLDAALDLDPSVDTLEPEVAEAVLRITQEALHNVAQHAGVGSCVVAVTVGDQLELVVEDAGRGAVAHRVGVGTTSMRVRAADLGGAFATTARPGGGTRVTVTLPLRAVPRA